MAVGLESADSAGVRYQTSAWSAFAALRVRFPIEVEGLDVALLVGWRMQSFQVRSEAGATPSGVADMDLSALHFGVAARIPVVERLALSLDAAYLYGLDQGALGAQFPSTSTAGLQAGVGLAVRVVSKLEVRAGFELRLWSHSLGRPAGAVEADRSAEDRYLGGSLGLALRL